MKILTKKEIDRLQWCLVHSHLIMYENNITVEQHREHLAYTAEMLDLLLGKELAGKVLLGLEELIPDEGKKNSVPFVIVNYIPAKECTNPEVYFSCMKCEVCGRRFDRFGLLTDDGGTTIEEEDEQE